MSPLLLMEGVAGLRGGRLLFEDVDIAIGPGGGLWLKGPNGVGKSSLIRIAAGLLRAAAGRVEAVPAALADDSLALDRERRLGDALAFWARMDGGEGRLGEAMAALDLDHLAEVPVRMLSTGQARRARLARVLVSGALLWLLDEPLNGLDAASARRVEEAVAKHRASGGAVLAASHLPLGGGEWQVLELGT